MGIIKGKQIITAVCIAGE